MAPFTLLPDVVEDELHGQRLLRVEERPFERIKNRLLGQSTPFYAYLSRKPTDANGTEDLNGQEQHTPSSNTATTVEDPNKFLKDLHRFREDVILDFAAFEASIARIQFLRDANERERQRYATEKLKIQATAQDVRDDTARLKIRLEEAKKTLEIRKGYDVLAEKITKDARLKPRDEQESNIERLRLEIEELKTEQSELSHAWIDRREQFARVVEEGKRLRRVVRDEKEPEHGERGDEEGEDERSDRDEDGDENMLGVERHREDGSMVGTPRPTGDEDASTPMPGLHQSGAATPRSTMGDIEGGTPRPIITAPELMTGQVAEQDKEVPEDESLEQNRNLPKVTVGDEMDIS